MLSQRNMTSLAINHNNNLNLEFEVPGKPILTFLNVDDLTCIERVDPQRVMDLEAHIEAEEFWTKPILVHDKWHFIMDGHHRFEVSKRMGFKIIPALLLNYNSPFLKVVHWDTGKPYDINLIYQAVLEKKILGVKSNRHILTFPIPSLKIPINMLKKI